MNDKELIEKCLLRDEEIYVAVTHGFSKKVEADNLTDEIELKRHESVKEAIKIQLKKAIPIIRKAEANRIKRVLRRILMETDMWEEDGEYQGYCLFKRDWQAFWKERGIG